jgi:hypothetical protein
MTYRDDKHFGTYRGRRFSDMVRCAAFNHFGVTLGTIITGGQDCDMDYYLVADARVTKPVRESLRTFIEGMSCAYNAR